MTRPEGQPQTAESARLAGPDHLRAFAITYVLIFHYRLFAHPQWIEDAGSFGWTGVDLFFVLSGYLIAGQLFKEMVRHQNILLKPYFTKRFFRIIPVYAVILALYFLVPAFKEWEHLPPLWRFLTFTQNLGLDRNTYRTFSHAWSLCVEEQFYLLFPFVLLLLIKLNAAKKAAWLLAMLFVFGFAIRLFCWYRYVQPLLEAEDYSAVWFNKIYYPTYSRLDGLLAGITLAALWNFKPAAKAFIQANGNKLFFIGTALIVAAYFVCKQLVSFQTSIFGFPLIAIAYGCLLAAFIAPSCFIYKLKSRITSLIAALSYSLYLSHKAVIHFVQNQSDFFGIQKESTIMFVICIVACILAALLLRNVVEKPFMRLRDVVLSKYTAKKTVAANIQLANEVGKH